MLFDKDAGKLATGHPRDDRWQEGQLRGSLVQKLHNLVRVVNM
jgi:hypothetical protein